MLHIVPAGNPSLWTGPGGNNTYLLTGRVPTLIDAGVGAPEHVSRIARLLEGKPLQTVLITHAHPDHIGGVDALRAMWPGVRVARIDPPAGSGHDPLQPGELVPAGDRTLRIVATPGHAPDHCCFYDEPAGDLFCGDLVRLGGTIAIQAGEAGDLSRYLDSLRAVRDLMPRRLLPGHGPIVERPRELVEEYLAHRAEREQQVLDALDQGISAPDAIAARIYGSLPPAIAAAAADTVLAHLIKLRSDGRARETGGRWELLAR